MKPEPNVVTSPCHVCIEGGKQFKKVEMDLPRSLGKKNGTWKVKKKVFFCKDAIIP